MKKTKSGFEQRVREVLERIYEAGQYHKLAKSNEKYKQKDIDQAFIEILKAHKEEMGEFDEWNKLND